MTDKSKEHEPVDIGNSELAKQEQAIEEQAAALRSEKTNGTGEKAPDSVPTMPLVNRDRSRDEDSPTSAADGADSQEPAQKAKPEPGNPQPEAAPDSGSAAKAARTGQAAAAVRDPESAEALHSLRTRIGTLTFLLFLIIVALIGGAFYFFHYYAQQVKVEPVAYGESFEKLHVLITSQGNDLAKAAADIDRLKEELGAVRTKLTDELRDIRSIAALNQAVTDLDNRQKAAAELQQAMSAQLASYESRNPDEWRMAQVAFLVTNAYQMAVFNSDIRAALWCLQNADQIIRPVEEADALKIREAINMDIATLKGLPQIDFRGILYKLDSVYNNIPKLQLEESRKLEKTAPADATPDPEAGWFANLTRSMNSFLSRFIEIRHRDDAAVNAFLSPEQANILAQNIQSEVLMAKFALYHGNDQGYTNNLAQATHLIEQYYDHETDLYKSTAALMVELKGMRVSTDVPNTLRSYSVCKSIADQRLSAGAQPQDAAGGR